MNICCTNISFLNINTNLFIKKIREVGYKNIEFAPFLYFKKSFSNKEILNFKKIILTNKIQIISLQSIFYNLEFNDNIELTKNNVIQRFAEIINIAKILSIKKISLGSCPLRKINSKEAEILNIDIIKKFALLAKKIDASIFIEPVHKKYGNSFLQNIYEVTDFVNKIRIPNVKILVDTGNLTDYGIDFKNFFLKYYNKIEHIHLSNSDIYKYNKNMIFEYIMFLYKQNYKHSLSVEYISNKGINLGNQNLILSNFSS